MSHKITYLVETLGITELQAHRMLRAQQDYARSKSLRASNWLK